MKSLVNTNPLVVFFLVIIGARLINFTSVDSPTVTTIIRIIGAAMCAAYPLSLQQVIQDYVPKKVTVNENFYLINGFVWFAAVAIISTLNVDGEISLTGWKVLPALYVAFAYVYFVTYPAKLLLSARWRREVRLGEYIGDALLMLILPIGIWFNQPKVKRVVHRELDEEGEIVTPNEIT
ncbi:hypothetical protein ACFOET_08630 [Parapedobacter deserti]|uniref:Uncharacterized protein n=1 Tax=Parapedobacter deserti TaxID=1912957 RepID=A0ABV7JI05_9SPHI